jgi:Family of unknown function (DUF6169)
MALLLRPYPIQKIDEFTYGFVTSKGIEYYCSFISYAEYFSNQPEIAPCFFSFNLELKDKKAKLPKGTDKQIVDTVITIVGDFLLSKTNAVVYVCDNSDGREAVRARKFLSWYSYEEHPSHKIIKVSGDLDAGGITLYTALLVHKNNKLKKELVQAYLELIDYEDEK